MENLITKTNELFGDVRFVILDEKQYAVANDILRALGYSENGWRTTISRNCKHVTKCSEMKINGSEVNLIPSSDILILIQKSKNTSIEYKNEFKKWLVEENIIEDKFVLESRKEIDFFDKLIKRINGYNSVYNEAFNMFYIGHASKEYTDKINPISNIKLEFQKIVCSGKYRLDCFIEDKNLVIEYNEKYHESQDQKEADKERENDINDWYKDYTGEYDSALTFIRVKEGFEDYYIELIMCYLTMDL